MIKLSSKGYPGDIHSQDYMDSCVRMGIMSMTKSTYTNTTLINNYELNGYGVRCPVPEDGKPCDNPNNFTRDQLLLLLAGLKAQGNVKAIRRLFWSHAKRLFFCQNIERDKPGSVKKVIPHKFYKDSNPVSTTYTKFSSEDIDPNLGVVESKSFDYRDPLLPNHIWAFIVATKYYWLYPLAIIGVPAFLIGLYVNRNAEDKEENQAIAEAYLNGNWALKLYKRFRKHWETNSFSYWFERSEIEYHYLILDFMKQV